MALSHLSIDVDAKRPGVKHFAHTGIINVYANWVKVRNAELVAVRQCTPDCRRNGRKLSFKGYGLHVWALLNLLKTYHIDQQAAARVYALPDEAIDAVLAYYELHKQALDARVALVPSDDPMPRAANNGAPPIR